MGIVDDLLAQPGLYVGGDRSVGHGEAGVGAARILVTALPGGAGVSLDYEVLDVEHADGGALAHSEHTIVGTGDDGRAVMVIAHTHGPGITILGETEPGVFEPTGPVPYPLKVVVSVPEPGRLRHSWWYGRPGGEAEERDIADVHLVATAPR